VRRKNGEGGRRASQKVHEHPLGDNRPLERRGTWQARSTHALEGLFYAAGAAYYLTALYLLLADRRKLKQRELGKNSDAGADSFVCVGVAPL